jgi:hypothetical protein
MDLSTDPAAFVVLFECARVPNAFGFHSPMTGNLPVYYTKQTVRTGNTRPISSGQRSRDVRYSLVVNIFMLM